ncbi:uncharacterized protein LOC131018251 [Salvia miltiorrhiza]|uniref:uncharacterized protein LOC131018251 n=1 Tax=Salvia miltiorrhiza TaxID=226208 RepID=UPI0025AB7F5B|nr:uncharacterized protein LOC131018251 [Salvia miltiorrhiza]
MMLYITTLGLVDFLWEDEPPAPADNETSLWVHAAYDDWRYGDYLCKHFILEGLEDSLYNVYANVKTSKPLWQALENKYCSDDVIAKFLDFKMIDGRSIMDQVQEFQLILHELESEGMKMPEAFITAAIIEMLPPSWIDFKSYLMQNNEEMTLEDLMVKLRLEFDVRECMTKVENSSQVKGNLLEKGGPSNNKLAKTPRTRARQK